VRVLQKYSRSCKLEFTLATAYKQALVANKAIRAMGQVHTLGKGKKTCI